MNDTALMDEMVGRLAEELKRSLRQVREGQLPAAALKGILTDKLWHVGAQALGVMLEALDRQLASGRRVHDHRTRTVVSLFGRWTWVDRDAGTTKGSAVPWTRPWAC